LIQIEKIYVAETKPNAGSSAKEPLKQAANADKTPTK